MAVAWSGGKDAAWALKRCRDADVAIAGLMIVLDSATETSCLNSVPRSVLQAQAECLDLPTWFEAVPNPCPDRTYRHAMRALSERVRRDGVDTVVFGDICLPGIREYRRERMAGTELEPFFPLWGEDTAMLAREMVGGGLQAIVSAAADSRLLGQEFDGEFLEALSREVDPCGERGEFHTLVYGGPFFSRSLPESVVSFRQGFGAERNEP